MDTGIPGHVDTGSEGPADTRIRGNAVPGKRRRHKRTGSMARPYERDDGARLVNVSFTLPVELVRQIRVYTAGLEQGRSAWAADCLRRGMRKGA